MAFIFRNTKEYSRGPEIKQALQNAENPEKMSLIKLRHYTGGFILYGVGVLLGLGALIGEIIHNFKTKSTVKTLRP